MTRTKLIFNPIIHSRHIKHTPNPPSYANFFCEKIACCPYYFTKLLPTAWTALR